MKIEFQLQNIFHPIVLQCVCPCEGIPTIPFIYQKTWYGILWANRRIFYNAQRLFFAFFKSPNLHFAL